MRTCTPSRRKTSSGSSTHSTIPRITGRHMVTVMALAASLTLPGAAQAQTQMGAHVFLELNTAQTVEGACTLTFQVINGHANPIEQAVYEAVLFTKDGTVDRLTLLDFGALPASRPRVRQFAMQGITCEGMGRILINGVQTCTAPLLNVGACETDLELNSRVDDIEVLG